MENGEWKMENGEWNKDYGKEWDIFAGDSRFRGNDGTVAGDSPSPFSILQLSIKMKRFGNLIEKVADMDNIRYAFYLASKGKHRKQAVQEWLFGDMEQEFVKIRNDFLNQSVRVGKYNSFKVYEPKERVIYAAEFRDRVVQHALMNVCHEIFDRFQIADSYACRVGKGQYKALEKAQENSRKMQWFVKLDIRKYFDNIDHEVLKQMLRRKIKDPFVLDAFDRIIDSYQCPHPGEGGFSRGERGEREEDAENAGTLPCLPACPSRQCRHSRESGNLLQHQGIAAQVPHDGTTHYPLSTNHYPPKGLPIGNLTSQYFANFYLGHADHFIKETLKTQHYARYMDDMLLWGNDKETLLLKVEKLRDFIQNQLHLELKEICLNRTSRGLSFLGYRVFHHALKLTRASKKRYIKKITLYRKLYEKNIWTEKEYHAHAAPLTAFVLKADTLGLRKKLLK
ncbi:MAG: reverse transcriptase/maturase family protein [Bacteroidales bacterium]|jgi:hypothetical protein|nr:reverse transcriptase/maturase family protein [Bacteroidales bacterium]